MITNSKIIIFLNIFVQIYADELLFPLFHKDVSKRYDRARSVHAEPIVWYDLRNKNSKYFKLGVGMDESAMGYFIHVVPKNQLHNRRFFEYNRYEGSSVIGVPSSQWHLPNAEPILPGHTLIRPTIGMLKSAVTFPHVPIDIRSGGAGIYGNPSNLGIRYGGRSGRILYSSNRRMFSDSKVNARPTDSRSTHPKSKYYLVPVTLDSVRDSEAKKLIIDTLSKIRFERNYQHRSKKYYLPRNGLKRNIYESDYDGTTISKRRTPKLSLSRENKMKQFWLTKDDLSQLQAAV
ncbi:uncharacterized protein LOC125241962 isoform X2 [Leguminivora glycinivorella]|uniref:uncharacterized protein LOC125241962 isoform X2 n=1 Tax=Leguminivora glycinivorella TaxID=1035111 RepID=UPI00200E646E|nr:uncharacterized protein LOC125241962 isoform X2 [Leguminivora glycinivorella]